MGENGQTHRQGKTGFRAGQIPALPESPKKRERIGEDLQPVGDYAGIEPYYRVCEDVGAVQHQDQDEGAEWLKLQAEYPWEKRTCKLTPQLGKVSMDTYREQIASMAF